MLDKITLAVLFAAMLLGSSTALALDIETDKLGYRLDDEVNVLLSTDRSDTEFMAFVKDRNGAVMENLIVVTDFEGNAEFSFVINPNTWNIGTHEIIVGEQEPEAQYQFQIIGSTLSESLEQKRSETVQIPSQSEQILQKQNEKLRLQLNEALQKNQELKSEIQDLKDQVKSLRMIIQEQINVIMEWIKSR